MTQKFKYYVTLAYLDTSEDDVKFEYIENQAYNAKDAVALAKSYMSQFGNVQGLTMDVLTTKQKNQMYDEISDLLSRYGKKTIARLMIKAFATELKQINTSKDLNNMQVVLVSLKHLLEMTFPTK